MSEEFTFDDICHFNWHQSVCIKSQKNMNFTMSDVSKIDNDQKLFPQETQNNWNIKEFNKKNEKKMRNRNNVKNYRQRKKGQQEELQKRVRQVEEQNKRLRSQRICGNCKRPLSSLIKVSRVGLDEKDENLEEERYKGFKKQSRQEMQFQKVRFEGKSEKQQGSRNGKIWIALGILMLVIGVHLYGLRGKQGYQDISISKIQSKKWIQVYENKVNNLEEYFNVKLKVKDKENQKSTQKQKQIFKQIRIFHQEGNQVRSKDYEETTRNTIKKLHMIEEAQQNLSRESSVYENLDQQISFHKQLLYAIQAQIDDVGNYI